MSNESKIQTTKLLTKHTKRALKYESFNMMENSTNHTKYFFGSLLIKRKMLRKDTRMESEKKQEILHTDC